jgi:hypothetical protein
VSAWFSTLGEPLGTRELGQVREYLGGLGVEAGLPVELVGDWPHARSVVVNPAWDRRWWDAEQRERRTLYSRVLALRPEEAVLKLLSHTVDCEGAVRDAAARAADRFGCTDVGLVGAAAGAASHALYLGELARLAQAEQGHPFCVKEALFAGGRWPLGILDGRYWLF